MTGRILLIETGGTIGAAAYDDPRQPPQNVTALPANESLVMNVVANLPNSNLVDNFEWKQAPLFKDSKQFTRADIEELAEIITAHNHRYFIITHGTDAMAENAATLKEMLACTEKIVVFTGAMIPLSMSKKHGSDAVDNLGFTLENILSQKPGVYLVGRNKNSQRLELFTPKKVKKAFEESRAGLVFTVKAR